MTLLITAKAFWASEKLPNCIPLQDKILKCLYYFYSGYTLLIENILRQQECNSKYINEIIKCIFYIYIVCVCVKVTLLNFVSLNVL